MIIVIAAILTGLVVGLEAIREARRRKRHQELLEHATAQLWATSAMVAESRRVRQTLQDMTEEGDGEDEEPRILH